MATIILLVLFVLMWVVLIVPRQRELRRHQQLMRELEVGDEVMTGSGIYGTITELEADLVHLAVAPGVELKVARRAVAAKVPDRSTEELAAGDDERAALDAEEAEIVEAAVEADERPGDSRP